MSFSEAAKNLLLQEWVADRFSHLTLMSGPSRHGLDYSNELGYRHVLDLDVSDGIASNSSVITIPVASALEVTHIGLTNNINLGSGTIWMSIPLKKPVKIKNGGKFRFEVNSLQFSIFNYGPTLGFNVEPNSVGTFGYKFLDCFKAGRDFSGTLSVQNDEREIIRDSDGWPAALLPDQVVRWHVPTYYAGDYRLEWDGTGTLVVENGSNITTIDANTIEFEANQQETIRIRWDSVGPVNARCFHTALETEFNNGDLFVPQFLGVVSEANALRFGDAFDVRRIPATSSVNDRPLPTDASESIDFINYGMSIESMCALCNAANADLWLCVPVAWVDGGPNVSNSQPSWANSNSKHPGGWTEQQVNQIARVIKAELNTHLKIYVEHGNNLLSLDDDNADNYKLASGFGSQLRVPTYQSNGRILYGPRTRDVVYAYHAWRTSQLGKEFKKILSDRVETVLTMESGDREMHARTYQFLVKQELLKEIDAIALNPTLGNRSDEPLLASELLDNPDEFIVLDINDSSLFKVGTEINLRFVNKTNNNVENVQFLELVNWNGGATDKVARDLARVFSSREDNWVGISIQNRVILSTPGYTTTANLLPSGISQVTTLSSGVIADILCYSLENYYSTVNNSNRLTAEQFQKPLYASTIGLRDEGGPASIAGFRQQVVMNDERAGVLAGMIGKWRHIAAPTYTGSDDSAPTLMILDSRWGGENYQSPKSTRQLIEDYNEPPPDIKLTAFGAVFGRDGLNNGQGMLNNVFGGIADVVVTHLNLLDEDMNEVSITSRVALPLGLNSGAGSSGKRSNSAPLVFTPSGTPGAIAHYLGYYTAATGNTLVAATRLTDKVIVQDGEDITFPANSIIIAG